MLKTPNIKTPQDEIVWLKLLLFRELQLRQLAQESEREESSTALKISHEEIHRLQQENELISKQQQVQERLLDEAKQDRLQKQEVLNRNRQKSLNLLKQKVEQKDDIWKQGEEERHLLERMCYTGSGAGEETE
ncbi:hypothetical protein WMY93_005159 [Mugilogobius chulae]|uniref:Uncharacterized protein n=1 Tax=Mugilogobius chulae TaxID=88201 RepID=A0AAW0PU48_9GOBI